jgi:hypothetical protein
MLNARRERWVMQMLHAGLLIGLLLLLPLTPAWAGQVAVRFAEGVTRAFPALSNLDGQKIAHGDFMQVVRGDRVVSRMTFRFTDGSLYDETVTFSQREVFTLLSYRIVQRGPSFPETIEASIDRETETYTVRHRPDEESPVEVVTGRFTMPDDAYNGMLCMVLRNLAPRTGETVSLITFMPQPRVVKLALTPAAEDAMVVGNMPMRAVRYHIRPQLGPLASLLMVDVPDVRVWVLPGEAPAFLRAEGPLYFMGPIWRVDPY